MVVAGGVAGMGVGSGLRLDTEGKQDRAACPAPSVYNPPIRPHRNHRLQHSMIPAGIQHP